jgi:quercetin dioxygenase-like cupin family protein
MAELSIDAVKNFVFNDEVEWEDVNPGVRRKLLAYDKDLMTLIVEFKKDSIGYIHKHFHTQISYIISGSFEVTINGEKKIQKAGDAYYLQSNIEHGVVALEDSLLVDIFTPAREDFIK